ncbi:MAG: hypothetical protein IJX67_10920 [Oscillospiraceae bacterium]|nr:hypothetical protein [Oscillospiraceae bacterium]
MSDDTKRLIFTLKRIMHGDKNRYTVGKMLLETAVRELTALSVANKGLKEALDAANRETATLKAENERLHSENFWLSKEGTMAVKNVGIFDQEEVHHHCTVQILRNSLTGEQSVGWWPENEPPAGMEG